MKIFVIKVLIIIVPIFCSVGILNFLYVNTNYWKNETDATLKFKNVPQHIQIANIGSSHGLNSFDYDDISNQSFNFSLSSQRFIYDFAILKQYKNSFDKNAVLLIPISYFQITQRKIDFKDSRARYYRFLANELIDQYSLYEKMLFKYVPVLTAGNTLQFIIKDISLLSNSFMTEQELLEYCEKKYIAWTTDSEYEYEAGEDGFVYNKNMAKQIIDFCYANDIQPVLVTTPITSVLNTIYKEKSPDFFDTFYRFSRELQEDYPSLLYFDYSHDPRFETNFSLFRDGDHLNAIGARKFTSIVVLDLQTSGVIIPSN